MKPAPFDYYRPESVEEACRLLDEASGGAVVIAGGQTLMPLLNLRMSQPFVLVDLAGIAQLQEIRHADGTTLIGPMVRQNDAMADPLLARHLPLVGQALAHVGHHQTRNRGTLGGSLAFGEPAAELPAVALAMDATIHVQSTRGKREIAAQDFYFGPYATALAPDEIITAIAIADWPEDHVPLFREIARRPGDFALVGLAGACSMEDGRIDRVSLAWFGMGPTPIRASEAEAALLGTDPGEIDAEQIAELAVAATAPFDDKAASSEYRRTVGRNMLAALLREKLMTQVPA